ncbi:MAG: hypothetical protein ACP5JJ_17595 [Anaerolineae bacterium]
MEPGSEGEVTQESLFCPTCGAEEQGYFCRQCGTLLRGEEMVLCPRCHQIVPDGDFCNQCGQSLSGIALHLRQLALAGGDFWVTSASSVPEEPPDQEEEPGAPEPDEEIVLDKADLPDWLQELPKASAPDEVKERIYPALQPVVEEERDTRQSRFLITVIVLMGLLLVGLVAVGILFVMQGG